MKNGKSDDICAKGEIVIVWSYQVKLVAVRDMKYPIPKKSMVLLGIKWQQRISSTHSEKINICHEFQKKCYNLSLNENTYLCLPMHVTLSLSSRYPSLQLHSYNPSVLVHSCVHLAVPSVHSLISKQNVSFFLKY